MDNKLILEGILWDLKGISSLALYGALESKTNKVNKVFRDSLLEFLDLQHTLFNKMFECGMYDVCNVEESKIAFKRESIDSSLKD